MRQIILKLSAIALLTPSLLTTGLNPAMAKKYNPYRICVAELKDSGIKPEDASIACANAIVPEDLSLCVLKIAKETPVKAETALPACLKVRRPLDLASCVYDINDDTEVSDPNAVVNYCRLSLLPLQFSECVVGLTQETPIVTTQSLETCIDAEDFPRGLLSGIKTD